MRTKLSLEELCKFMPEDDAREVFAVMPYFRTYFDFKAISKLGLFLDANLYSFDKIVMWAWIEEFLSGRKT